MISRVTLSLLSLLGCIEVAQADSGYLQKLKDFSFDMGMMHEYPVAWDTHNSAVPILSKVKVLPNIARSNG